MIPKTPEEKSQLVLAKANYAKLKNNVQAYNATLHSILSAFSKSTTPMFGAFTFNGQRVPTL
jgi:hypothetical protein